MDALISAGVALGMKVLQMILDAKAAAAEAHASIVQRFADAGAVLDGGETAAHQSVKDAFAQTEARAAAAEARVAVLEVHVASLGAPLP